VKGKEDGRFSKNLMKGELKEGLEAFEVYCSRGRIS